MFDAAHYCGGIAPRCCYKQIDIAKVLEEPLQYTNR
uniref:Uncharacterized protein n=1 Tax=Setaria italica TaxID=4555 RepID=K3Z2B1_SETIT